MSSMYISVSVNNVKDFFISLSVSLLFINEIKEEILWLFCTVAIKV